MESIHDVVAVEATLAQQEWTAAFGELMGQLADLLPRRDSRLPARETTQAMLRELERRNCWTLAEALGHDGPHRLQHFLSRGAWDHDAARDRLATWACGQLAGEHAVLILDETGDAKSSADCVGAAHQYSGALGGVGLCQVAVHMTYALRRGHALADRELYLPPAGPRTRNGGCCGTCGTRCASPPFWFPWRPPVQDLAGRRSDPALPPVLRMPFQDDDCDARRDLRGIWIGTSV